jgi:hypothetical protein
LRQRNDRLDFGLGRRGSHGFGGRSGFGVGLLPRTCAGSRLAANPLEETIHIVFDGVIILGWLAGGRRLD